MNTPMPATEESNTAAMAAAAPAQPMVRFASVTKRYGELTVLEGLDLDVQEGEKVAIIGPSGSGKSTLLRVLMTLEGIDDGLIEVDGEPLTHMPDGHGRLVPANARHLRRVRGRRARPPRLAADGIVRAMVGQRLRALQVQKVCGVLGG